MTPATADTCTECGSALHSGDKFCPECGHQVPAVEIVTDDTEVLRPAEPEALAPSPPGSKRSRKPILIAAVCAIGLILAGGAWWGLTQNSPAKNQYKTSGPVLVASLDDMSGAQSTKMVRDIAGDADAELTTINRTLADDPKASGADRLTTLRDAFAALAALRAYEQDNTQIWADNRPALQNSLDSLTGYGGETQTAASEGEDAIRTLDDLTRRVDKAMAKYRKQLKQSKAEARTARGEAANYHAQMESLIDQYTGLRNDTGAFTEQMRNQQMYMYEIGDYFTQAATDRREIRDQMAGLRPPAELRSVHTRIVTVLGDGVDGINSAVAALEDAECYYDECYFEFDTQWQQFLDESDRITARYGEAYDAWQAAVAQVEKRVRKADLPARPQL